MKHYVRTLSEYAKQKSINNYWSGQQKLLCFSTRLFNQYVYSSCLSRPYGTFLSLECLVPRINSIWWVQPQFRCYAVSSVSYTLFASATWFLQSYVPIHLCILCLILVLRFWIHSHWLGLVLCLETLVWSTIPSIGYPSHDREPSLTDLTLSVMYGLNTVRMHHLTTQCIPRVEKLIEWHWHAVLLTCEIGEVTGWWTDTVCQCSQID